MTTSDVLTLIGIIVANGILLSSMAWINATKQGALKRQVENIETAVIELQSSFNKHKENPMPHQACVAHSENLRSIGEGIGEIKKALVSLSDKFTEFMIEHAKSRNGSNSNGKS